MRNIRIVASMSVLAFATTAAQFQPLASHNAYFTRTQWAGPDSLRPYATDTGVRRLWAGIDVDEDGKQEVIATDYSNGGRVHVFELVGPDSLQLVWSSPRFYSSNDNSTPRWVKVGDLDGDGNREIIFPAGKRYSGAVYVFEYNGTDNSYGSTPGVPDFILSADLFFFMLGSSSAFRMDRELCNVSDLDGDGRDELIMGNQNGNVYILGVVGEIGGFASWRIEGGDPAVHPENRFTSGTWWQSLPADIDGDGSKEIVNLYFSYYGFWSIDVKGPDSYRYPTPGIDSMTNVNARTQFYHEYLRERGVDATAYMGLCPADVDGDGKQELAGILYTGGSDIEYNVALVSLAWSDTGVYVWKDASQFGLIGEGFWTLAGQTTGDHWGIAAYDFDGDGKDEIYVGGSDGYRITQMKYNGTGSILDKNSYTNTIVYSGGKAFYFELTYFDSLGVKRDTTRSTTSYISGLYAGGDVDNDGKKELCLSYQSVADSITHRWWHYDTTSTYIGFTLDSTKKTVNSSMVNIQVLEYQGPTSLNPIQVHASWNLLSVPVAVADRRKSQVFPTAVSNAFTFNNSGYVKTDTLERGKGYWIKFPTSQGVQMIGLPVTQDTFDVSAQWGLIGSLTNPVLVSTIQSIPDANVLSPYIGYRNGYYVADTLTPGEGYWVRTAQAGKLALSATGVAPKRAGLSIASMLSSMNCLLFGDSASGWQRLYYGLDSTGSLDGDLYQLPPRAPEGVRDIRYASGRIAEIVPPEGKREFPISISSATFPVTISWDLKNSTVAAQLQVGNREISLRSGGSVVIPDSKIQVTLRVAGISDLPHEYNLGQNYPNPFNPTTTIRYQLPSTNRVVLRVYTILGQEVKTLVDGVEDAGYKSVIWNSRTNMGDLVATGMYFYRLEAGQFVNVKKMMVIK